MDDDLGDGAAADVDIEVDIDDAVTKALVELSRLRQQLEVAIADLDSIKAVLSHDQPKRT